MTWRPRRLSEFGKVVTGKTPPTTNSNYWDGEFLFVTPSDLNFRHYYCSKTKRRVSSEAKERFRNQFLPENSVMFTSIGNTIGKCAISSAQCLSNQQINSIIANGENDFRFVYYLLCNNVETVKGLGASSATPIVNKTEFEQIRLKAPDLPVQQRIGSFLAAYDDLIENNRRRIQLLEQSARMLYKEWFVQLRFPGHEHVNIKKGLPEGWERKPLGEVGPLNYGKSLREDERVPGGYPVYGSSGIVGTHEKALVKGPGIIVGRKGNVGSTYWSDSDFHPIDTVYYIDPSKSTLYLYYALLHTTFLSTDVAVPGLNRDLAHSKLILVPEKRMLDLFLEYVSIAHKQMSALKRGNELLAKARDILLPKLMSGEVEV